jgi:hypothetical protein
MAISVKSQMSSISKNATNRFEEYVGDATNLHARYPMLVLGFLLIVPVNDETVDENGRPSRVLLRIRDLLCQTTGRDSSTGLLGSYVAASLVLVDFEAESGPVVHPTFPEVTSGLRIEGFFDRLMAIYRQRNHQLQAGQVVSGRPGRDPRAPAFLGRNKSTQEGFQSVQISEAALLLREVWPFL